MVDVTKLKRKSSLPPPPTPDEASPNLDAPEHAPAAPTPAPRPRIDGRSLRRTHRTVQFATRVSPEFDDRIRAIAEREGLLLVEILEKALDAYEAAR